jgi:hypothetical protein
LESPVPRQLPDVTAAVTEWLRLLGHIGTGLWRLRQRLLEPGSTQPREEMRRANRDLEGLWDTLAEAGVEILDHTGAPFDAGMSLKVIAFQPTPGIVREKVLETVKPTIYYKKQWIQMGEVIVAMPEKSAAPATEGAAPV